MANKKRVKRKVLAPVGTPSVPIEDIRRAVRKVKAARKERERAARARRKG